LYGMDAYLMIMHELEKARLPRQARKGRQKEEPSPTGIPPSATGKCTAQLTRRR
jgi:hypothetical protein